MFDIKQRYRRSTHGPLWMTLSTGIMVGTLGVLWSTLFKTDLQEFMPFFAAGLILWTFLSGQIIAACTGYTQFEGYIKQINLPLPLYLLRIWSRNMIILAHNMLVFIVIWMAFGFTWTPNLPMLILGFVLMSFVVFFASVPIAILCTRFRDITPIIQSLVQVLYFFTPIMWQPKTLPKEYAYLAEYNPLHHLMELVRAPMLGQTATLDSWLWSFGLLAFFFVAAVVMHTRYRARVAYWL